MRFGQYLQDLRKARGWSQAELADRLGVSRQTVVALEQNHHGPSLEVAIRIANLFNLTMDSLVSAMKEPLHGVQLFPTPWLSVGLQPVIWSQVGSARVLVPTALVADSALPDALWDPSSRTVLPLPGARSPERVILMGGCDPFMPWLSQIFQDHLPGYWLQPMPLSSSRALKAWQDRRIHIAGTHLFDPVRGCYNPREWVSDPHLAIPYLLWEEGLMTRAGEGEIRRLAIREPGSEAHALYQRHRQPLDPEAEIFTTHRGVLEAVSAREGWAGVGLGSMARLAGLSFEPWAQESYDLWIHQEDAESLWAKALLEVIRGERLSSRLIAVPHVALAAGSPRIQS